MNFGTVAETTVLCVTATAFVVEVGDLDTTIVQVLTLGGMGHVS